MATVTKPLALNESLNSTENTPRNIADVLADELDGIKQAISSQSGSGDGHIIQNSSGANMPQENTMQFTDSHLTDDSVGGKTKIETFKAVTESDYASETEDGAYIITDGDGATIGEASDDYVEVVADGVKTYGALLNELYVLVDRDKIQLNSTLVFHNAYYRLTLKDNNTLYFSIIYGTGTDATQRTAKLSNANSWWVSWVFTTSGNTKPESPGTSDVAPEGTIFRLYYGNKKAVVDLQTTANRCVTSDGGTVQSNLNRLNYSPLIHTGLSYTNCTYADGGYSVIGNVVIVNIRVKVTEDGHIGISNLPRPKTVNNKSTVGVNVFRIQQDKASQLYAYMMLVNQTTAMIATKDVTLTANEEYAFSAVYVSDYTS